MIRLLTQVNESAVGGKLWAWRNEAGWTQTELANRSGVSANYISEIERCITKRDQPLNPSKDILVKLALALHKNPVELLQAAGYDIPEDLGYPVGPVNMNLLAFVSKLTGEQQRALLAMLRAWDGRNNRAEPAIGAEH